MIYIGIEVYNDKTVTEICDLEDVSGVVVGDVLCNKRMFENGEIEMLEFISEFKKCGKKVVYQTPMYLTEHIYRKSLDSIKYLIKKDLIDTVLVQDVGCASDIRKISSNINIVWSRMGYARTPSINEHTIDFYIHNGVTGFECKNLDEVSYVNNKGLMPIYVYGYPTYTTINRECYYMYQNDIFDGDCKRECLNKHNLIIPGIGNEPVSIDGYSLGWKYQYSADFKSSKCDNIVVYCKNVEELREKLFQLRGENL